jgi:hypothetical protein
MNICSKRIESLQIIPPLLMITHYVLLKVFCVSHLIVHLDGLSKSGKGRITFYLSGVDPIGARQKYLKFVLISAGIDEVCSVI